LPAWAPVRVVLGHGVETADIGRVREQVETFFRADTPDGWRQDFLSRFGVQYLLVGPHERQLGAFDPAAVPYLILVWRGEEYALWTVK